MVQTDLNSDNFCGFNQSASPMFWVLDPIQTNVQFNAGETGVFTGVGLHTPQEVIDVSSMIVAGGRDNLLTNCTPPVPSLPTKGFASDDSIRGIGPPLPTQGLSDAGAETQPILGAQFNRREGFGNLETLEGPQGPQGPQVTDSQRIHNNLQRQQQNIENRKNNYSGLIKADGTIVKRITDRSGFLQPQTTSFKRSAMDYDTVDWQAGFAGNGGNLHIDPQNLTNVIERMWLERGGLDQNQLIKQSQEQFVPNTGKGPMGKGEQTCKKIRQPYNIRDPFGLPTGPNGEVIPIKHSRPFNALDVASVGGSSPLLDQDNRIPFNYNAMYSNGGCNKISFLKDNIMCNDKHPDNDLTGVNAFSFSNDIPPAGLHNPPMHVENSVRNNLINNPVLTH